MFSVGVDESPPHLELRTLLNGVPNMINVTPYLFLSVPLTGEDLFKFFLDVDVSH
jgi:hypothetical protein